MALALRGVPLSADVEPASVSFGVGALGIFEREPTLDFSGDIRFPIHRAWVQPRAYVAWATDGSRLIGAGLLLNRHLGGDWRVSLGFGPGYYERNRGRNLGSSVEFLSTIEISRSLTDGLRGGLVLEHISNGSISNRNPGTETLRVFFSRPLGK